MTVNNNNNNNNNNNWSQWNSNEKLGTSHIIQKVLQCEA